jgi:hypothetical protein
VTFTDVCDKHSLPTKFYISLYVSNFHQWLRRLVASLLPRRSGFAPGSVFVGFVAEKVALGQVCLRVIRVSPVNMIPSWLHTHISSGG